MKIKISGGTRTNMVIEGCLFDILFDMSDMKLFTMEGMKIVNAIKEDGTCKITKRTEENIGNGVTTKWIVKPNWTDTIFTIMWLDDGDFKFNYFLNNASGLNKFVYKKLLEQSS